jgi:hypothetical protein
MDADSDRLASGDLCRQSRNNCHLARESGMAAASGESPQWVGYQWELRLQSMLNDLGAIVRTFKADK